MSAPNVAQSMSCIDGVAACTCCSLVGQAWGKYADGPARYLRFNAGLGYTSMALTAALALEMVIKVRLKLENQVPAVLHNESVSTLTAAVEVCTASRAPRALLLSVRADSSFQSALRHQADVFFQCPLRDVREDPSLKGSSRFLLSNWGNKTFFFIVCVLTPACLLFSELSSTRVS